MSDTQQHSPRGRTPAAPPQPSTDAPTRRRRWISRALRAGLLVTVLAAAGVVAYWWLTHRPRAERRRPEPRAALVEVRPVQAHGLPVTVEAMGTVVPAREVSIAARVPGEVVRVSEAFVPGGLFRSGQTILQIDREDYEIAVRKARIAVERARLTARQRAGDIALRKSELAKAREALKVEQGAAEVARSEYELLGETIGQADRELVLRKPQLASARAAVEAAEAAVESAEAAKASADAAVEDARTALRDAELDLERTTVTAPFDGAIVDRSVETGSQVAAGEPLATYVCTEAYWVRLSVPLSDLQWVDIPGFNSERGSAAAIHHAAAWGKGVSRRGTVQGLMTSVESGGQMAQLLVTVADPLDLSRLAADRHALILDAYVRAEITGRRASGCVRVPRVALREGDAVWVMSPQGTLEVRPVEVLWSTDEAVYVRRGLDAGERLIVSDLAAPVEGMELRTTEGADGTNGPAAPAAGGDDTAATTAPAAREGAGR
ncbi:MAG: efflux RND transporter periplasmic adaptor subunit [Planctomycetota bacterium]